MSVRVATTSEARVETALVGALHEAREVCTAATVAPLSVTFRVVAFVAVTFVVARAAAVSAIGVLCERVLAVPAVLTSVELGGAVGLVSKPCGPKPRPPKPRCPKP